MTSPYRNQWGVEWLDVEECPDPELAANGFFGTLTEVEQSVYDLEVGDQLDCE